MDSPISDTPASGQRRLLILVVLTALCVGVIFCASTSAGSRANTRSWVDTALSAWAPDLRESLPPGSLTLLHATVRKLAHVTLYAALGFLVLRLLLAARVTSPRLAIPAAVLACLLCAAADEWHQARVPSRTSRRYDVALDGFGALLGIARSYASRRKQPETG